MRWTRSCARPALRRLLDSIKRPLVRLSAGISAAIESIAPLQIVGFFNIGLLLLANFIPLQLDGDEIVLSIMSIQKLTVYYWAQDRYGNLASLLTAWVQNPIYNAYAQLFIRLLAGLIAPMFFCALVFRRSVDVWCATLLSAGLLLLVGSVETMLFTYVQANPYSTSLACAGLGAMALRVRPARFRRTPLMLLGVVVLLAAYIVNFGLVIVALPLVGLFAMLLHLGLFAFTVASPTFKAEPIAHESRGHVAREMIGLDDERS